MNIDTTANMLRRLWRQLTKKRRYQIVILFFFNIFASFAEVMGIGLVVPFIGALTMPDKLYEHELIKPFFPMLNISSAEEIILPMTIIFGTGAFIASITRLSLIYVNHKMSNAVGLDVTTSIYRRILYQSYDYHVNTNSSEILGLITKTNQIVPMILMPSFSLLSSILMLVSVISLLIAMDPFLSIIVFSGFGISYFLIAFTIRKRIRRNSEIFAIEVVKNTKAVQEGLGGIRDILLDGSQELYARIFNTSSYRLRKVNIIHSLLNAGPKFLMEFVGMMMIALLAYSSYVYSGSINSVLPTLGALALGAQRMLPVLQQGYSAWVNIKNSQASFSDILSSLEKPLPSRTQYFHKDPLPFSEKIQLRNLAFRYQKEMQLILDKVSLDIPKGSRIGFIGATGSGKSTFIDIIMGLLEPTEGSITVDEQEINEKNIRAWQLNIAHVPQSIYLSDSSIAENIALGVPFEDIDHEKIKQAAKQAQISNFIENLKDGYGTYVGERGIRLSGGQRQRIGIARALYKDAKVIVFDEATSALDNETEKAIMKSINLLGNDLTILMIAHRLSTVKNCDKIIELEDGKILREGSYKELFEAEKL
ncbi:MAG: ABC transporter ATP-binding protein/permease [Spirochaetia bacterium]|nr:ABC transporter ATP-binding protein/permease [Spirochaetia bacterium]